MAYTVDAGGAWVDRNTGKGPQHYNRGQGGTSLPVGKYETKPSAGGSSGGSSGSSGGTVTVVQRPSYDPTAAYLAFIREQQEAERRAREEAYNKAVSQQKENYNYATSQLNAASDQALREAYINRMLSQRNLQQQLTAQGLNGGASETTTASMLNNYNNARNELERERQEQLSSLANTYQNNMAQLEAQKASGDAASIAEYAPQLASFVASNIPTSVNLTQMQGGNTEANLGYLEYLRRMAELMGQTG